jgi:cation:H+ antiporter
MVAAMTRDVAGLVVSLVLVAFGGDQFIIAIARLAGALRVRPTVVGLVLGGFGTSIVELIVAALAAARHSPQLAVGSLVGSVIANVCLALTIAALIAPIRVGSATVRREAPLSVAAVAVFAVLAIGGISFAKGIVMLVALVPVLGLLLFSARGHGADTLGDEVVQFLDKPSRSPRREVVRAIASLVVMLGGADLMVNCVVGMAARLGMGQGPAGLTLVGIGTSAPLIASSVQGARRGEHELVMGNVLGGNLFIALGGGALVGLLTNGSSGSTGTLAPLVMVGAVVVAWLAMARGSMVSRWEALLLLAAYVALLPFISS